MHRLLALAVLCAGPVLAGCGSASSPVASTRPGGARTTAPPSVAASLPPAGAPTTRAGPSASRADAGEASGAAGRDCGGLLAADATAKLPGGFPAIKGFVATSQVKAGATTVVKGYVSGGPGDLAAVRDAGLAALTRGGYKPGNRDQQAGADAHGDFTGPHAGTVDVKPLCSAHLVVTYTLSS